MKQIIILTKRLVIMLSSCALISISLPINAQDSAAKPADPPGRDCISQSSIRDYQVLDDSNLIVSAGGKRKYHVKLSRRAMGLRSNWQIGFKSPSGRICGGFGEVIVGDGFGRTETIRTTSIRQVDEDQLDELLVRFGKKDPDFEQTPAQEEVDGAEVEELD